MARTLGRSDPSGRFGGTTSAPPRPRATIGGKCPRWSVAKNNSSSQHHPLPLSKSLTKPRPVPKKNEKRPTTGGKCPRPSILRAYYAQMQQQRAELGEQEEHSAVAGRRGDGNNNNNAGRGGGRRRRQQEGNGDVSENDSDGSALFIPPEVSDPPPPTSSVARQRRQAGYKATSRQGSGGTLPVAKGNIRKHEARAKPKARSSTVGGKVPRSSSARRRTSDTSSPVKSKVQHVGQARTRAGKAESRMRQASTIIDLVDSSAESDIAAQPIPKVGRRTRSSSSSVSASESEENDVSRVMQYQISSRRPTPSPRDESEEEEEEESDCESQPEAVVERHGGDNPASDHEESGQDEDEKSQDDDEPQPRQRRRNSRAGKDHRSSPRSRRGRKIMESSSESESDQPNPVSSSAPQRRANKKAERSLPTQRNSQSHKPQSRKLQSERTEKQKSTQSQQKAQPQQSREKPSRKKQRMADDNPSPLPSTTPSDQNEGNNAVAAATPRDRSPRIPRHSQQNRLEDSRSPRLMNGRDEDELRTTTMFATGGTEKNIMLIKDGKLQQLSDFSPLFDWRKNGWKPFDGTGVPGVDYDGETQVDEEILSSGIASPRLRMNLGEEEGLHAGDGEDDIGNQGGEPSDDLQEYNSFFDDDDSLMCNDAKVEPSIYPDYGFSGRTTAEVQPQPGKDGNDSEEEESDDSDDSDDSEENSDDSEGSGIEYETIEIYDLINHEILKKYIPIPNTGKAAEKKRKRREKRALKKKMKQAAAAAAEQSISAVTPAASSSHHRTPSPPAPPSMPLPSAQSQEHNTNEPGSFIHIDGLDNEDDSDVDVDGEQEEGSDDNRVSSPRPRGRRRRRGSMLTRNRKQSRSASAVVVEGLEHLMDEDLSSTSDADGYDDDDDDDEQHHSGAATAASERRGRKRSSATRANASSGDDGDFHVASTRNNNNRSRRQRTGAGQNGKHMKLRRSDIGGCRACRIRRTPSSALRKPRSGDRVAVLWEDRNRSFSGTLGAMIAGATWQFEIKYDDGYEILEDLDNVHWRFEECKCASPWYEPGDLADDEEQHKDRSYRCPVSKSRA